MNVKVALASLNGTVVLLILTAAGAFLARKKVLDEESAGRVAESTFCIERGSLLLLNLTRR